MKKIISMILILMLSMSMSAAATADSLSTTSTYSEYDAMKDLTTLSTKDLQEKGYSKEEIQDAKEIMNSIKSTLKELKKYDKDELKEAGYSESQIDVITKISDTDIESYSSITDMPKALFGSLSFNLSQNPVYSDEFRIVWSWASKPFYLKEDGIGVAWDNGFRVSSKNIDGYIQYTGGNYAGKYDIQDSAFDIDIEPGEGWSVEFDMVKGNPNIGPTWAYRGDITFTITNPNDEDSLQMVVKYGHGKTTYNVGVSIDALPSVGFSNGVDEAAEIDNIFYW